MKEWLTSTDTPRLLMVDTDMIVPPETISRLVGHNKDIVGGLAFTSSWSGRVTPTLHVIREDEEGKPYLDILWDYPTDSLVQVDGTGGACLMITRTAAMKIWEARGWDHPMPWFAFGMHNGVRIGEDIAFCLTAGKVGLKIYVDTGLEIPHVKPKPIGSADYVRSLLDESHPYYTQRDGVPIFQELLNGNSGLNDDKPNLERVSEA